jgi:predicted rRNA methylase YqxC with S4 and FtsJ domains
MSSDKERLDVLLVEQGYFESREKAKAAIMAGLVFAKSLSTRQARRSAAPRPLRSKARYIPMSAEAV